MACHAPCEHKAEASRLRKELRALDPDRVRERIDKSKQAEIRAVDERDRARKKAGELQCAAARLRGEIESLKDRLAWAGEELRDAKESWASEKRKLKRRIGELEKELSTARWRLEKQGRDSEKSHKKAMAEQEEEYKAKIRAMEERHSDELSKKDAVIKALTEQARGGAGGNAGKKAGAGEAGIASPKADSSNSSTSPAQDPNHATITNNRERSGLKPGAQKGHKPQPRKRLEPDRVVELPPPQPVLDDPGSYYEIGEKRKQVVSMRMVIDVTEYVGKRYRNHKTRAVVCSEFPDGVGHLEVNYDESVEAYAAFLHSVCNVPYNKVQELLSEAAEGGPLRISTGKLAGMEKKFSSLSGEELAEIWGTLFSVDVMNIDGTPVRVNGKQRQVLVMRGGDTVMYKMTGCKGGRALEGTPAEHYRGTVVCDGESTFTKLGRRRQGCLVHEGRYVRHAEETAAGLTWHRDMRALLKELQRRRNEDMAKGIMRMPERERKEAGERYTAILEKGLSEYGGLCGWLLHRQLLSNKKRLLPHADEYSLDFEAMRQEHAAEPAGGLEPEARKALQKDINTMIRLMSNKEDYLLFLGDYTIPPHNNDAEKSARTVKVHVKPNGGMRSDDYVGYYADTATVLETEHARGGSRFGKLKEVFKRGVKDTAKRLKDSITKRQKTKA